MFSIYSQGSLCKNDGSWVGLAIGSETRVLESSLYERNIRGIRLVSKAVNNLNDLVSGMELPFGSEIEGIGLRRDLKKLYITVGVNVGADASLVLSYVLVTGSGDAVLFSN